MKRIRGVAHACRASPHMANRMVDAARGVLNALLADVYIFTDHRAGPEGGLSPGYGISLVAETTSGCFLTAEVAKGRAADVDEEEEEDEEMEDAEEKGEGGGEDGDADGGNSTDSDEDEESEDEEEEADESALAELSAAVEREPFVYDHHIKVGESDCPTPPFFSPEIF